MSFASKIIAVIERQPGISDRHLSEAVGTRVQQVNGECHHLQNLGLIERRQTEREDIGNYPVRQKPALSVTPQTEEN